MQAYRRLGQLRDAARFAGWLMSIARRSGADGLKVVPPWNKNRTGGVQHTPRRFPEDRLRSVIEEIQLATKTMPDGAKPFTLDVLRARLSGG